MARIETQAAQEIQIERRTECATLKTGKGEDPTVIVRRIRRNDGFIVSETDVVRNLSAVAGEQFGNTALTVAQAAQALADTFDRWAVESEEP